MAAFGPFSWDQGCPPNREQADGLFGGCLAGGPNVAKRTTRARDCATDGKAVALILACCRIA